MVLAGIIPFSSLDCLSVLHFTFD